MRKPSLKKRIDAHKNISDIKVSNETDKIIFIHIPKTAGMTLRKALKLSNIQLLVPYFNNRYHIPISAYNDTEKYYKFSIVRNPYNKLLSAYNYIKENGSNIKINFRDIGKLLVCDLTFEQFIKVIDRNITYKNFCKNKAFDFINNINDDIENILDDLKDIELVKLFSRLNVLNSFLIKRLKSKEDIFEKEGWMLHKYDNIYLDFVFFAKQSDFVKLDNKIAVDIYKYENLDKEWNKICDILNIDHIKLDKPIKKHIVPVNEIYTKEMKDIVYKIYKEDFETFGYSR